MFRRGNLKSYQEKGGVVVPVIDTIVVKCACGKKLKAPAQSMGKKARCPACGNTLVLNAADAIPARAPGVGATAGSQTAGKLAATVARSTPPAPSEDDGLNDLFALAEQADIARVAPDAPRCPQCRSTLDEGSVLCTQCGYDTRTGKALSTAKVKTLPYASSAAAVAGKRGKKPIDLMAPQGTFVVGLAMSAVFALVASLVWIAIAWSTGFAISYVAFLIGGAAGAGMKIGQKGFSHAGGFTAAAMTLVAIAFAKVAVIEILLARQGLHRSIFDLNAAKLGYYFFNPIGLIIIAIGMGAAYRTANGSISD